MKKLFLLFILISLLVIMISGCENAIPQVNDGDTGQAENDLVDNENSPGPAPNSGDGVSDGPGWEDTSQEVN